MILSLTDYQPACLVIVIYDTKYFKENKENKLYIHKR